MARNPAQVMSSYGVATSVSPVSIAASTSYLPAIASYARPPHDVKNAKAYAYWLAHGGRRRRHRASLSGALGGVLGFLGNFGRHGHRGRGRGRGRFRGGGGRGWYPGYSPYYDSDPSTICVIDPRTGIQTCMPAQSATMLMPSMAQPVVDPYMASQGVTLHPPAWTPPKAGWGRYDASGGLGVPGGFRVARIGSAGVTAGFHDYGYADAFGSWGALDPAQILEAKSSADEGTESSQELSRTLTALSPAITTVVEALTDPYKRVKILEAKIKKAKRSGASASKIQRLQAKLEAAKHRLSIKDEALESTRDWRMLGKAGIVTGIGIGAAIIFFIFMQSFKPRRAAAAAA